MLRPGKIIEDFHALLEVQHLDKSEVQLIMATRDEYIRYIEKVAKAKIEKPNELMFERVVGHTYITHLITEDDKYVEANDPTMNLLIGKMRMDILVPSDMVIMRTMMSSLFPEGTEPLQKGISLAIAHEVGHYLIIKDRDMNQVTPMEGARRAQQIIDDQNKYVKEWRLFEISEEYPKRFLRLYHDFYEEKAANERVGINWRDYVAVEKFIRETEKKMETMDPKEIMELVTTLGEKFQAEQK